MDLARNVGDRTAAPACGGVAFVTLGCKVNQTESESIAEQLASAGLSAAAGDAQPSVIVINTCTVTGEADVKARKAIRRALALPGEPRVIVTGCMAVVDPEGVAALGDRVTVEPDKSRVAGAVLESAEPGTAVRPDARVTPVRTDRRARVQIKVQDGCDAYCAYCIVPYARGVPRSVAVGEVLAEVTRLHAEGVGEVVLTGINIGRYDDGGLRLPGLVERVAATGIRRVRISSIEPDDVTPELLEVMGHPSVARHLHVPLQSGCDVTLAGMGRRYDTARYADVVARIRAAVPGIAVTTDLLVGFPGETDEHFERTLAFVREMGLARLHVFRYSARPGTVAAALPDQVPAPVRAARGVAARVLGDELACEWASTLAGSNTDVLVERIAGARAEGTSGEYVRVSFDVPDGASVAVGDIERIAVTGSEGAAASGERIDPRSRPRR